MLSMPPLSAHLCILWRAVLHATYNEGDEKAFGVSVFDTIYYGDGEIPHVPIRSWLTQGGAYQMLAEDASSGGNAGPEGMKAAMKGTSRTVPYCGGCEGSACVCPEHAEL